MTIATGKGTARPFIEHRGIRYYRDAQGWRASACKGHRRLHVVLWEEANGPVPHGFHVFCSDPERPSLANIGIRPAYAGFADNRVALHAKAEREWRDRTASLSGTPTRAEIAAQFGVSRGTAERWGRALKIPKAKTGRKPKYDERIRDLRARGLRGVEIAKELGISQQNVRRRLILLDLPRYPRFRREMNLQRDAARP